MDYPPNFIISRTSLRSTTSNTVKKPSKATDKNLKLRRNKALTSLKIMKITSPEPGLVQSSTAESKNLSISQELTSAVDSVNLNLQLSELKQAVINVRSFGNDFFDVVTKIIQQKQGNVKKRRPAEKKTTRVASVQKTLVKELRKTLTSLSLKVDTNESLLKDHEKSLDEIKSKIELMLSSEKTKPPNHSESTCLIY